MRSPSDYSALDRALHRLALARPGLQLGMAELEDDLFRKQLARVPDGGEVFVTGLPRAGTTLVLELLHATGEFASFTYRQMPFVLAPLLWNRIVGPFRRQATASERAHGDGMSVSYDSPEAFEEVIWLAHLRDAYVREDRLLPLTEEHLDDEFVAAFRSLVRKCRLLGWADLDDGPAPRYLAKNNANASRLPLLGRLCPDARVVLPFRHPLAHVGSLMKQHALFCARHDDDAFGRHYMQWLGHFEFGRVLRPFDYDGWLDTEDRSPDAGPGFWLHYWRATYQQALASADERVLFVDFDALLQDGRPTLERIASHLALRDPGALIDGADRLRAPTTRPPEVDAAAAADLEAALAIHEQLQQRAR
jgi:hypothetical protein